ncbi:MAG: DNA repair protein RecN, partial [Gammaproteobacteria bacterium]
RWLEAQDFEAGDECILRRTISADGRSRASINGSPANLGQLRDLGSRLIDIHGQHEHQSLMQRDAQRALLDEFAGDETLLQATREAWQGWQLARKAWQRVSEQQGARDERLDLLRYQVNELEQAEVDSLDWEALTAEHDRLANATRLGSGAAEACTRLYEADELSAYSLLSQERQRLEELQALDPELAEPAELLEQARILVQEAADSLRRYADGIEHDPARLAWLEERMGLLTGLARKHHCEPGDLPAVLERLRAELDELEAPGQDLESLAEAARAAEQNWRRQAMALHEARHAAGQQLAAGVTEAMQKLGMEGGRFEVAVALDEQAAGPAGTDRVDFLVSANPGQPLRPLAKVASGGELARISLAIQMLTAGRLTLPTLIFDEVDSGIGGGVAEIVGQHLARLGEQRQVLCVTHLPQVASQAHHHFRVVKEREADRTGTRLEVLDEEGRVQEIARMLGGVEITEQTLGHAREMLDRGYQSRA